MIKDLLGFFPGYMAHPRGRLHLKPNLKVGIIQQQFKAKAGSKTHQEFGLCKLHALQSREEKVSVSLLLGIRVLESQETFWRYSAAIMFLLA